MVFISLNIYTPSLSCDPFTKFVNQVMQQFSGKFDEGVQCRFPGKISSFPLMSGDRFEGYIINKYFLRKKNILIVQILVEFQFKH